MIFDKLYENAALSKKWGEEFDTVVDNNNILQKYKDAYNYFSGELLKLSSNMNILTDFQYKIVFGEEESNYSVKNEYPSESQKASTTYVDKPESYIQPTAIIEVGTILVTGYKVYQNLDKLKKAVGNVYRDSGNYMSSFDKRLSEIDPKKLFSDFKTKMGTKFDTLRSKLTVRRKVIESPYTQENDKPLLNYSEVDAYTNIENVEMASIERESGTNEEWLANDQANVEINADFQVVSDARTATIDAATQTELIAQEVDYGSLAMVVVGALVVVGCEIYDIVHAANQHKKLENQIATIRKAIKAQNIAIPAVEKQLSTLLKLIRSEIIEYNNIVKDEISLDQINKSFFHNTNGYIDGSGFTYVKLDTFIKNIELGGSKTGIQNFTNLYQEVQTEVTNVRTSCKELATKTGYYKVIVVAMRKYLKDNNKIEFSRDDMDFTVPNSFFSKLQKNLESTSLNENLTKSDIQKTIEVSFNMMRFLNAIASKLERFYDDVKKLPQKITYVTKMPELNSMTAIKPDPTYHPKIENFQLIN